MNRLIIDWQITWLDPFPSPPLPTLYPLPHLHPPPPIWFDLASPFGQIINYLRIHKTHTHGERRQPAMSCRIFFFF